MKKPVDFSTIDVDRNVQRYMTGEKRDKGRHPDERYASFDYCFNYFQSFRDEDRVDDICCPKDIQQSCLQLGFYLASWGMLRGSSFLLNKSAKFHGRLLEAVVGLDEKLWIVDVDSYTDENIGLLLEAAEVIRNALGEHNRPSDTLVTKIMLGIYGNIPAFDSFFQRGLGVGRLNEKNLKRVAEFYRYHKAAIDKHANSICTFDFHTGKDTDRYYTKAKIVDMVVVTEGQQ